MLYINKQLVMTKVYKQNFKNSTKFNLSLNLTLLKNSTKLDL